MKESKKTIVFCWWLWLLLASCSFGDEPGVCPYNIRLEYWYAGNPSVNELPVFVDNMRQYLFDEKGMLIHSLSLGKDSIAGWQTKLPPGTYTVVVWGNMNSPGKDTLSLVCPGEKTLQELSLSSVTPEAPPGYRTNTGRLYYGSARFEVEPGSSLTRRVYLSHAHASLNVTVQWMADRPADGAFTMRLKGVPAVYSFVPGWENTLPSGEGSYGIPQIGRDYTNHEARAAMNYQGEVTGELVSFRYTATTHPYWSLWRNGKQIIKDLDLFVFFSKFPMDMDRNIEQEFDLLVTVYENRIVITQAGATDWEEGGMIG